MSQFDDSSRKGQKESGSGSRVRRGAQDRKNTESKPKGASERFFSLMQKWNDPFFFRKKRLPDPSQFPEGQVPLWVSDPEHYTKRRTGAARFWHGFGVVVLHLFLICCMMGVAMLGIAAAVVYSFSDTDLDERFASMDLDYSSFIYATDPVTGEDYIYQEIQSKSGTRVWVSDSEIPQHVKDATVALEDQRFYTHSGVDPIRTVKAIIEYAQSKLTGSNERASGGSTLTQQVIKNMTGDDDYGIGRKVKEMLQALYIERRYNKDQILEYYLNTVYFGQSANGISAAAEIYFDKDVSELTVAEGAAIICITKSPSTYNPYLHPENNKKRRNDTMWFMYEQGYLTREEYDEYSQQELNLVDLEAKREETESEEEGIFLYNYYTDMVIRDVLRDLQTEKGLSEAEATNLLYHGGLQIYACVDPSIQTMMEDYFANEDNFKYTGSSKDTFVNEKGETEIPQVAMMVMDPETGDILGVIGGRGEKTKSLSLNRAVDTPRQPGSSIKPLSVYGYAIENDLMTLGDPIDDIPVTYDPEEKTFWPSNYDKTYAGLVSVKKALARSLNTPAAWGLKTVGIKTSYDFLINSLHFTTLNRDDSTSLAPLAVGALTDGVTLREMTTAYTTFAGDGMYTAYRSYSRIVGYDGKTVLENPIEREEVFSEQTAYLMTDILQSSVYSIAGDARLKNIATAGKSGTTSSYKDRWFIGYTNDYVAGIWWGYDTPYELNNTHHFKMWNQVMTKVHEMKNITKSSFEQPSGIVSCSVCWKSGLLPGPYCSTDPQGACVETFYYKEGTQPTKTCNVHHQLYVCDVSGKIAHENCPSATLKTFVDIDRSFPAAVKIGDAGYICPRLTKENILYSHATLPVYTNLVPEGDTPATSLYDHVANCLCTTHTPSEKPHIYTPKAPTTDTATGTSTGGGGSNQPTTDTGSLPDTGTVTDTATSTQTNVSDSATPVIPVL
ncbi:MAG: transglycosylase domain-containing protein [Clostridia bacterium]|nr:transglycosylase domain-containing protein [Clostridia bacterium]